MPHFVQQVFHVHVVEESYLVTVPSPTTFHVVVLDETFSVTVVDNTSTINVAVTDEVFHVTVAESIVFQVQVEGGAGGGGGDVSSVFGRTGAVVAVVGDYTPSLLGQQGATLNQTLVWNGSIWAPAAAGGAPVDSVFGRTGAVIAAIGDYNTDQVTEGSNLYFTEARANAASDVVANTAVRHSHANKTELDKVTDGDHDVISAGNPHNVTLGDVGGAPASHTHAPADITQGGATSNQALLWTGSNWVPTSLTTTLVAEGTNLYYTEARVSANTDVAANTAHTGGDGSDHANVALNDAHRGSSANPHGTTFTQAVAADGATDISAAEAETLTDTSNADSLHAHKTFADIDVDYIDFDTTSFGTPPDRQEGRVWYDPALNALHLYVAGSEVTQTLGHEIFATVYNDNLSDIPNGAAVVTDVTGPFGAVHLADASDPDLAIGTAGLATELIEVDTTGMVTVTGAVRDVDTHLWPIGTILYLSDTTPGGLTDTIPESPSYQIQMGLVLEQHATAGIIYVRVAEQGNQQGIHRVYNGSCLEPYTTDITTPVGFPVVTITSDVAPTDDLSLIFEGGLQIFTAPASVTLTSGTDEVPVLNYVYIPESTMTLTASTGGWPAGQYQPIGTFYVQSAASVATDGVLKHHSWTDHLGGIDDNGHLSDLNNWIRGQHATWLTGAAPTVTDGANLFFDITSGTALQLHVNAFLAVNMSVDVDPVYIVNDPVTDFKRVTNLNTITTDSTGASINNKYFKLVFMGVVNSDGTANVLVNLPDGFYNSANNAQDDSDSHADYSLPQEFRGTGFVIASCVVRVSGGTWTEYGLVDHRGDLIATLAGGGGSAMVSSFSDAAFNVYNATDPTKDVAFDASAITTGTERTLAVQDADGTIALTSDLQTAHSNRTELDKVTVGDHDAIVTGNPHALDYNDVGAAAASHSHLYTDISNWSSANLSVNTLVAASNITSTAGLIQTTAGDILSGDDLRCKNRLFINEDGTQADTIIYFQGSTESLTWDSSESRFAFSDDLYASGKIECGSTVQGWTLFSYGDVHVNYNGPDANSQVYFYDGSSPTGQYLRWSNDNSQFELSTNLYVAGTIETTGAVTVGSYLDVTGSLTCAKIYATGDVDTYIDFVDPNEIIFVAGGTQYMGVEHAHATERVWIGIGAANISMTPTGQVEIDGEVFFGDTLFVPGNIEHRGDADTKIGFSTNKITMTAGGEVLLAMDFASAADRVTLGPSGALAVNSAGDVDMDNDLWLAGSAYFAEYVYHRGDTDTYLRFQTNEVHIAAGGDVGIEVDANAVRINQHLTLTGNVYMPEYIYHTGDAGATYFRFQPNQVDIAAGGVVALAATATEVTALKVDAEQVALKPGNKIGVTWETSTTRRYRLYYNGANLLRMVSTNDSAVNNWSLMIWDRANDRVGINEAAPAHDLDVTGDVNADAYYVDDVAIAPNDVQVLTAVKDGDTNRINQVTRTADPDLSIALLASKSYSIEAYLIWSVHTTPDSKAEFTGPSGCDLRISTDLGGNPAVTYASGVVTPTIPGVSTALQVATHYRGKVKTTNAGNLTVDWAQANSSGESCILNEGSWLKATLLN